jgi:zinc protease
MFSYINLPFKIHKKILENGLTVVAVPINSPDIIAFYTVVRAGSRNEVEEGKSGYAHFFEHMMFRGTKNYSSEEYNKILKMMGADSNAYTTDDFTCYHIVASKENLEKIFEIESDRFINLNYSKEAFQKEAGAILGEYRKTASSPFFALFEKMQDTAYEAHTYKHTTMGFLKDILAMPENYEYSIEFYRRHYRPDNIAVIVAGDLKPEEIFALAQKYFGKFEGKAEIKKVEEEPAQKKQKRAEIKWENPTLPFLFIGFHGPKFESENIENVALEAIAEISFGEISPLYQELVNKTQTADFLEASWELHRDPYLFLILLRLNDKEKISEVEDKIFKTLENIKAKGVSQDELEKVKSKKLYSFLSSLNTPSMVANVLAEFFALSGSFDSLEKYINLYKKLDNETIKNVAKKYLNYENSTTVILYQKENL